jgi:hypothetical protein
MNGQATPPDVDGRLDVVMSGRFTGALSWPA